ncbi:hypothetical protein FRB91_005184 [Serendipita sp. 411]|nr:hypothetical protein FRB91_005184 [Serendipita sp. 411]
MALTSNLDCRVSKREMRDREGRPNRVPVPPPPQTSSFSSSPSSSSSLSSSPSFSTSPSTSPPFSMTERGQAQNASRDGRPQGYDRPREEGDEPRSVGVCRTPANQRLKGEETSHDPASQSRFTLDFGPIRRDGAVSSEREITPPMMDNPDAVAIAIADGKTTSTNLLGRRQATAVEQGRRSPLPLSIHHHHPVGPTQTSSRVHFQSRPVLRELSPSFDSPSLCSSSLSRSPILSYSSSPTRSHSSGEEGSRAGRAVEVESPFSIVDYSDLMSSTYSTVDISAEPKAESPLEVPAHVRPLGLPASTPTVINTTTPVEERSFVFRFGNEQAGQQRPTLSLNTRLDERASPFENQRPFFSSVEHRTESVPFGLHSRPQQLLPPPYSSQPGSAPFAGFGADHPALRRDATTFGMSRPSQPVIPAIPRLVGLHARNSTVHGPTNHVGVGKGRSMNDASIQALGGVDELAAIQEAIKAHQAMSQPSFQEQQRQQPQQQQQQQQRSLAYGNGGDVGIPPKVGEGLGTIGAAVGVIGPGQLLIPTTLDNSPPTPLSHPPVVINNNNHNNNNGKIASGAGGSNYFYGGWQNRTNVGSVGLFTHTAQTPNTSSGVFPISNTGASSLQRPGLVHPMANSPMPDYVSRHLQMKNQATSSPVAPSHLLTSPPFQPCNPLTASMVHPQASTVLTHTKSPSLLTPSGKTFALGGRVQNISRDEVNPILMFWPDNEPLPLPAQIRPPTSVLMALGGFNGPPPPILNTGNKGPIDAQPGDWSCGKCDYLNWRRRRVCANCYPHAEGNTDGTKHSTADVQERVAILASMLLQQQRQVQVQQQQIQAQQQAAAVMLASNAAAAAAATAAAANSNVQHGTGPGPAGGALGSALPPTMATQQRPQLLRADSNPIREGVAAGRIPSLNAEANRGYPAPPSDISGWNNGIHHPLPLNYANRFGQSEASLHRHSPHSPGRLDSNNLNLYAAPFTPNRSAFFEATPGSGRPSFASSRSSSSLAVPTSSFGDAPLKNSEEDTPSALPLLPAFLQDVVNDASESSHSSSSIRESPSPPSSASSTFAKLTFTQKNANSHVYDADLEPFTYPLTSGKGSRRSPPVTSGAHGLAPHPSGGRESQSSIWSLGYPGDRH